MAIPKKPDILLW